MLRNRIVNLAGMFFATVILLSHPESIGQSSKPEINLDMYSVERNTCDDWFSPGFPKQARQAHYFWFLGFVSGGNFALPKDQIGTAKMLNESQFERYVTEQCKKSRKHTITTIAMLFVETNAPSSNVSKPDKPK